MIEDMKTRPYRDRLGLLNLSQLTDRQRRGDLIQTHRMIYHSFSVNMANLFCLRLRGHSFELKRENFNTSTRLPEGVVNAPSINSFKNRYDKYCGVSL
ncbi:hypothetical protein JTB14_001170 [Gonioctena quinquepunctata]|nr:hypothetical protein JTB14_001170 [Gonioctena quinquepunctata]